MVDSFVHFQIYLKIFSERLRQHRIDVTSNFYHTLKYLINQDPECRDLVTLIYYNGETRLISITSLLLTSQYLNKFVFSR